MKSDLNSACDCTDVLSTAGTLKMPVSSKESTQMGYLIYTYSHCVELMVIPLYVSSTSVLNKPSKTLKMKYSQHLFYM